MKRAVLLLALIVIFKLSFSQNYSTIEQGKDRFYRAKFFSNDSIYKALGSSFREVSWIRDSYFAYSFTEDSGQKRYYMVNAKNKKIIDLFSIADSLNAYITSFKSSDTLLCRVAGKDYLYSIKSGVMHIIEKNDKKDDSKKSDKQINIASESKKREPFWKNFSADSSVYMFGMSDNIYISKIDSITKDYTPAMQISFDGEPHYSFTSFRSFTTDTIKKSVRGEWFGKSNLALFFRPDMRTVSEMTVVNSLGKAPKAKTYKFEMPNDKDVTQYELWILDANKQSFIEIDISRFKDQEVKQVRNFNRSVDYKKIYFTRKSRTCDTLQLCEVNPFSGEVNMLIEETRSPLVNELLHGVSIINGGDEIIWWSEREGMGAYYLYSGDGKLKHKIVGGDFLAGPIFKIDTVGRKFIFEGYGYYKDRNPYDRYYFTVDFNGKNFKCITPSNGYHDITLSACNKFFIDSYSSVDKFPSKELRDLKGKLIHSFPSKDTNMVINYGYTDSKGVEHKWRAPKSIKLVAADDSTNLYGVMYMPSIIESGEKYPLIFNLYPGPQTDLVPRTFSYADEENSGLAQMGFIVVNIGLRGSSPYRGPKFYGFSHGNLRDYPLDDLIKVLESLVERYDFIDKERVGIYGHSGGGFLTLTAMLTYPHIFKVGVSVSGNHDNNIYAKFWGETYNGYGSKIATNIEIAHKLEGKLLLITGDVDDNVHPANTFRVVDALIKAQKRFDMFVIPGADHNMYGEYYNRLIRHYFINNL